MSRKINQESYNLTYLLLRNFSQLLNLDDLRLISRSLEGKHTTLN